MFWTTSRLSASARSWLDDLDPEVGGVARAADVDRLAVEEDLTVSMR